MSDMIYDVIVIGAGPGGYVAALRAAQNGLKTAIIEKDKLGGMCLNWGCIPSKSLMASSALYQQIKQANEFGISGINIADVQIDWTAMKKRAFKNVQKLTSGVGALLKARKVEVISGLANVIDRTTLEVNQTKITFKNLIIATGSDYALPQILCEKTDVYTPKTIYGLESLPPQLTIIGAGVVGIEFAMLFAELGVKVTVLEQKTEWMSFLDEDLHKQLNRRLKSLYVELKLAVSLDEQSLSNFDHPILFCGNRQPVLSGVENLLALGLEKTKAGFLKTDKFTRTSIPNIYAVGDINGRVLLAHVASKEAETAVNQILEKNLQEEVPYRLMPYNMYGSLEFASVGLTEQQARAQGYSVSIGKFPLSANGKALADGKTDGFVKIVSENKYQEILGVHIAASNATDLIVLATMAMMNELTVSEMARLILPHPTLSETMVEGVYKGLSYPLHSL